MTDKEKLEKIKELADAMYYAAGNLGPNVGSGERLRKTMGAYHEFIIYKYHKEEPVSNPIDFEKELYKAFGQVKDFTLGMRIAKRFYEIGRNHQEPVSEDFEVEVKNLWKEINTGHNYSIVDSYDMFYGLCMDIAEWQKEHLMANAVDVEVKVDAGGYPYIDKTIELYDYCEDVPLAKEGDKYKVILIKGD